MIESIWGMNMKYSPMTVPAMLIKTHEIHNVSLLIKISPSAVILGSSDEI